MVPVSPDAAATAKDTIHGLCDPDREPAHATLELRRPVRLYHQVQMIRLNAVLQNAEPRCAGSRQGVSCSDEGPSDPERRNVS